MLIWSSDVKNADPDKHGYGGYRIGFNTRSKFSLSDGCWDKNVIVFGVDNSSSEHVDNKEKDILVLGEGPTQELDDTTITAEVKYPINFTESEKRFVLSRHNNRSNNFLFVNARKIYQFKAKDSEIKTAFR